eukprot:TRINITY_DN11887_c0_g1_i1.p1 TRINITY_DN11887_c0_g1~~TRINITY_DN11887_c0_g1_i1.p1  ORF type:complete len:742 (+),score=93.12 TRINITY_DN11887_c0_g1_i1:57-2228(+)
MGIPKYHKWLTERYPDAFAEAGYEAADHIYVDINSLLHDCMRHASSKDGFFTHLFSKLDALFRIVQPSRSVFLAVDGPASCAKCLTQRQRRRAHAQKDAKKSGKAKGKGKHGQSEPLSNNMLTPGVPFMTELTTALEYYAASRMASGSVFARCESVTTSGAHAVGEGEHKIVSQMLRQAARVASAGEAPESHVIFSGDADIFLLSLVQSACRRVRVVSERPQEGGSKRHRGTMLQIWNAEVLARYIHSELTRGPAANPTSTDEAAIRRDFAVVSLFAGNDYLPELRCSLKPQKIWEQYLILRRKKFPKMPLVEAYQAQEGLPGSHLEGGWALSVGEIGSAFVAEPYEHYTFHQPLLLALMRAVSGGGVQQSEPTDTEAEGSQKYLQGLLWILEMYHHGYCGDFYFSLEKRMYCFASSSVIAKFLMHDAEPIIPPRSAASPMRPLSCAICILPSQQAEQFLCGTIPNLHPMFSVDHPLLGSVNAVEQSSEISSIKAKVAQYHQEMMRLRNQGSDDSQAKAMLTKYSQQLEELKKGGSDIDVVPLREVDDEVAERCADVLLPVLEFAPDVTMVRSHDGVPFTLPGPAQGMKPARCIGMLRVSGEWPKVEDDRLPIAQQFAACVEDGEQETCLEEATPDMNTLYEVEHEEHVEEAADTSSICVGDDVEAYWPDDDVWIMASVEELKADGSCVIIWAEDGSRSEVPADYVRRIDVDDEPSTKRLRLA